jgi:glycosyltransferase involved in cell wall biosynthesis
MSVPNKKVLFIAHHFPPAAGPAVNRALQFAKYLSAQGYELHVITNTLEDIRVGSYPTDPTLLEQLPPDLKIHRIPNGDPYKFRHWAMRWHIFRIFWTFFYWRFWEQSATWPRHCLQPALDLIEKEDIRIVWTTAGPFTSAKLGAMLRKRAPVKWVCDLRDPYTDTYTFHFPTKFHWHLSRWMERRIFGRADKLVVVTPGMKRLYLRRGIVPADRITVITNGYGDG